MKQGIEIAETEIAAELPWNTDYDSWSKHKQIGYEATRQRLIQERLYPDDPLEIVRDAMLMQMEALFQGLNVLV